ncbi:hypothetical protein FYK55_19820 [Roseiconus nitratireducens]|uniref:Uncharacterized protein n=1 Tax=Roseiconus nitratireducens TaxID=2605748 RepID=A0A5M6D612_9BACT|nr:hypothetical protein [Roseiconus nitratireducens]KAA5540645.1 hypothetical protein FYK55_19820 [Roseiconus nitratireducens]
MIRSAISGKALAAGRCDQDHSWGATRHTRSGAIQQGDSRCRELFFVPRLAFAVDNAYRCSAAEMSG